MARSRIYPGLPPHGTGQRIGILGGSFNPAHPAHRIISLQALRQIGLDRIWWMVTPGNPLKDRSSLASLDERLSAAADVAAHPRIDVSGAEAVFGTRYTADLIARLKTAAPTARLVWLMGSDNLAQFNRWHRWREIAASLPIAVVNRPTHLLAAASPAAQALRAWRIREEDASALPELRPPAWVFLHGPRSGMSSTMLRKPRS